MLISIETYITCDFPGGSMESVHGESKGNKVITCSDFIWPFLRPYMGVIPNPKMAFIFPISCILALIFPILIKYFPKCVGKGSFPKFGIKSLTCHHSYD